MYDYLSYYSLRSNTKGYDGKTHKSDETYGYTLSKPRNKYLILCM